MTYLTDEFSLANLKLEIEQATGIYTDREKERSRLEKIAREEHLKEAKLLTQTLNLPGIRKLFFSDRILCRGLTGNRNKADLLRIIVCRWLTNDREDCFLKYRPDIGFSFWHTAKDFAAETYISPHTIYKLIPQLKEEGWIDIYYKQDAFGRVKWHFKLKVTTFLKRLVTYAQSQLVSLTNCNSPLIPIVTYINQIKKDINTAKNSSEESNKKNAPTPANTVKETPEELLSLSYQPLSTNQEDSPQVDEKVNKENPMNKAKHLPKGDRYFQTSNQQSEIRSRAKMDSVVGMSGLKDMDHLEECRDRLTEYYLEIYDFETAEKKVNFEIDNAVRNGRRSQLIKEFLKGEALGVAFKQEWEATRGVLLPAFTAYLQHQLRKDGDTPEQVRVKIYWFKKDGENLRSAWAECKRIINIQKPKLKQAIQLGRDLNATDIPQWFIETFRPEIKIEEIVETAEVLGAIALNQATRTKQHQERLSRSPEDVPELEESHPIRQLLGSKGVLGVEQPTDGLKREQVDSVMDRVFPQTPDKDRVDDEINCLLADPITRDRGVFLAKKQNLPLLLNNEGVAIGIDSSDQQLHQLNEGHGAAHELYVPDQIEKGSKSAWEAAIAKSKSKFFQQARFSRPKKSK